MVPLRFRYDFNGNNNYDAVDGSTGPSVQGVFTQLKNQGWSGDFQSNQVWGAVCSGS